MKAFAYGNFNMCEMMCMQMCMRNFVLPSKREFRKRKEQ